MRKFRSALFFKDVVLSDGGEAISSTRASSNESAQEEAKYEIETRRGVVFSFVYDTMWPRYVIVRWSKLKIRSRLFELSVTTNARRIAR